MVAPFRNEITITQFLSLVANYFLCHFKNRFSKILGKAPPFKKKLSKLYLLLHFNSTDVLLVGIFENALKKAINRQKRHFGCFWRLIIFCAFSKIPTNTTFVRLLILKLKQKTNMKKYFFLNFFFQTQKRTFWGVNQFFIFSVLAFNTIKAQMFL